MGSSIQNILEISVLGETGTDGFQVPFNYAHDNALNRGVFIMNPRGSAVMRAHQSKFRFTGNGASLNNSLTPGRAMIIVLILTYLEGREQPRRTDSVWRVLTDFCPQEVWLSYCISHKYSSDTISPLSGILKLSLGGKSWVLKAVFQRPKSYKQSWESSFLSVFNGKSSAFSWRSQDCSLVICSI